MSRGPVVRPAADDGPVMVCTSDTHPELAHRLSHVIIPPNLVVPELMTSVGELTDWLVGLRSQGTTLCARSWRADTRRSGWTPHAW
ncbi:hypothetical protein [Streptomyces sp. NPDC059906]|uniref:hypothetical protein n=1 Tax=Streptomyces sp. NPDC059906 TaxID=3346997 RepID=UPI003667F221